MIGALAQIVVPVFLVIGAGYGATWRGLIGDAHIDGLMRFTQRFAVPCLLFNAIAQIDLGAAFNARLLVSFYAGATLSFGLGILGARMLGRSRTDSIAIGFGALFSNSVLIGLPVMTRAYGPDALEANFAIIAFHSPFCYLLGVSIMAWAEARDEGRGLKPGQAATLIAKNALIIGLALGFVVNLSGLAVPNVVQDALDMMIRAALPVALFALGGVLFRYRPEGDIRAIALVVGLSLLVHPALTYALGTAFTLSEAALRSAVVTAAMPPGVNVYIFADLYGRGRRVAATAVLVGTALGMVTAAMWLTILG